MSRYRWYLPAALILLASPAHAMECYDIAVPRDFDTLVSCVEKARNDILELTSTIDQLNRDIDLINRRFEGQARSRELRDKYDSGKFAIRMACQNRAELEAIRTQLKLPQPTENKVGNCLSE